MSSTTNGNPANYPTSITIPSDGDGPGIKVADVNTALEALADRTAHLRAGLTPNPTVAADTTETYTIAKDQTAYIFTSAITAARTKTLSNSGPPATGAIVTVIADASLAQTVTINDGSAAALWRLGNGDGTAPVTHDGPYARFIFDGTAWKLLEPRSVFRKQVFTADGNWLCPPGVFTALLDGWGSGGSGAGGRSGNATTGYVRGGGGGSAALRRMIAVPVVPGTSYAISIGASVAGGAAGTDGSGGNSTTFGSTLGVFRGGTGGKTYNSTANSRLCAAGGTRAAARNAFTHGDAQQIAEGEGGYGGVGGPLTDLGARSGGENASFAGGAAGATGIDDASGPHYGGGAGGGGGAGPGGAGGAGGRGGTADATFGGETGVAGGAGGANTGAGGGGGGGGGGGNPSNGVGGAGGASGSGQLTVIWVK